MQTILKETIYDFTGEKTWTDIHEAKKKYTSTGWLCGIEISTMDEPVRKIDEVLLKIYDRTILFSPEVALNLYNKTTNLTEFKGQESIRTIRAGLGKEGTKKGYKFEDGWHQIYSQEKWFKCKPDWFAFYFCTEFQWNMIKHVFGRVPGVVYL